MSWVPTYAEQTHDSPNPITRFAHRRRYRISLELADRLLPDGGTLVDYGAGEGTFLDRIGQQRHDARLIAIEPFQTIAFPNIVRIADLGEVAPKSVDVVCAFETLEHVTDQQLSEFLADARAALKPGGRLLVTVPIMYGLALPVKEASRALLFRRKSELGFVEMVKATAGIPIERAADRLGSHKGFDFRWLRREIGAHFTITQERSSPFPWSPWWTNSQAIFIAE